MNLFKTKDGRSVGKALIFICSLFMVVNLVNFIGYLGILFNLDGTNQKNLENGINTVLTYPNVIYAMLMSLVIIVAAFLILKGNKLGLFIYVGAQVFGTIYASISKTLQVASLYSIVGMILVLAWLVYRKKDMFFEKKVIV